MVTPTLKDDWPLYALGAYFVLQFVWIIRGLFKTRDVLTDDVRNIGRDFRREKTEFKSLLASFRRWRREGLSRSEALLAAAQESNSGTEFIGPRKPEPQPPPPEQSPGGFLAIASTILINAVSILGVYQLHFPVGTGLALYWAETFLTGLLLTVSIVLWRRKVPTDPVRGPALGEVVTITLAFNAAHLIFLLLFLGLMLPRIAPTELFELRSFAVAMALIAVLLLVQFGLAVAGRQTISGVQMHRAVSLYVQRVAVFHLTIMLGMFVLLFFGSARAFFAVFAGLKMIVDLTRRG